MARLLARLSLPSGTMLVLGHRVGLEAAEPMARVVASTYQRLGRSPDYLELHVYPGRAELEAALRSEAAAVGAAVTAVYEAVHEAWHGYPRIHVAASPPPRPHVLVHEAFHALLHGSLEYYVLPCTVDPLAGHAAATAVKDLEVAVEMARAGFRAEAEAVARDTPVPTGCGSGEDLLDALRGCALRLPLNGCQGCGAGGSCGLAEAVRALGELCRGYAAGGERPWRSVCRVARAVEKALTSAA